MALGARPHVSFQVEFEVQPGNRMLSDDHGIALTRDVTWHIAQYLRTSELEKLYISGVIPELASVLDDDLFWKARIEALYRRRIPFDSDGESRREAYDLLTLPIGGSSNHADNTLPARVHHLIGFELGLDDIELAICNNSVKILRFYIITGFDYRKYTPCPLVTSVKLGKLDIMQLLIDSHTDDLRERGRTAISHASFLKGRLHMVKPLLKRGVVPSQLMAVRILRQTDDREIIQLVLSHPHIEPSYDMNSLLRCAIREGRLNALELLLGDRRVELTRDDGDLYEIVTSSPHKEAMLPILLRDERARAFVARHE